MSGRNNPNNTGSSRNRSTNRRNNNRNPNNNNNNGNNGGNQLSNLPLPMASLPPFGRTITGFHHVPGSAGLSQYANDQQNIHAPPSPPPGVPSLLATRSSTNGVLPPFYRPITHQAASQGEENNNNAIPLSLPMRTMSYIPPEYESNRPANIPAFLEAEGVPLNTPISRDDTGRGPLPRMSLYIPNATPERMEAAYRRERASHLYQMLSDRGYFSVPPDARRPLREVLGLDEPATPSVLPPVNWAAAQNQARRFPPLQTFPALARSSAVYQPSFLPIPNRDGGELRMRQGVLGANAIDMEDFVDGEAVEVVYTPQQVTRLNRGERVRVTPSMVFRTASIDGVMNSGSRQNPVTREPIALRERRTLRIVNSTNASRTNNNANQTEGGKRKNRKSRKTTRKNRKH